MRITKISKVTGAENTRDIDVTFYQLFAMRQPGAVASEVVPHIDAEDLLFLMHGATLEEVNPTHASYCDVPVDNWRDLFKEN